MVPSVLATSVRFVLKFAAFATLISCLAGSSVAQQIKTHDDLVQDIQKLCDVTRGSYDKNNCQAQLVDGVDLGLGNFQGSLGLLTANAYSNLNNTPPPKRLGAIVSVNGFSEQLSDSCNKDTRYDTASMTWTLSRSGHTGMRVSLENLAEMWQLGFDLYVLDWCNKNTQIQNNATVLEAALQIVRNGSLHSGVTPLGPDENLIVIGYSMGGLVSRYTLADLENRGIDHGVDLWIPYDAPLEGAYLPISIQHLGELLDFPVSVGGGLLLLKDLVLGNQTDPNSPIFQTLRQLQGADTPAARQMLLVHKDGPQASGPTSDFEDLFAELDRLGYPHANGMRTVAIANGSGADKWTGEPVRTLQLSSSKDYINKTYNIKFPKNAAGTLTDPILWKGKLQVRVPATIELILNPLDQANQTLTVFEARMNAPGIYLNEVLVGLGGVDVGILRTALDLPDELPANLILSPFVQTIRDLVNSALDPTALLKEERRANVPVAYSTVPAGTGSKYQEVVDGLSKFRASGGAKAEQFIPTTSALGLNRNQYPAGTPVSPLLTAGNPPFPFDQVYVHDTETAHTSVDSKAREWLCDEISQLSATPHLTSIFPTQRAAGGPDFTLYAYGERLNANMVLIWTDPGSGQQTQLSTTFSSGVLIGTVPRALIADTPPCISEDLCLLHPEYAPVLIAIKNKSTGQAGCAPQEFYIEKDQIKTTPALPQAGEPFTITFSDTWQDSCRPNLPNTDPPYTLSGSVITINTVRSSGFCLFVITNYELHVPVKSLPEGNYTVRFLSGKSVLAQDQILVRPGRPVISSTNPGSVEAGGQQDISLTIYGSGFDANSRVMWNGQSHNFQFVDTNTLTTTIPFGDLAQPGSLEITVVHPDPVADLVSLPYALPITSPAVRLTQITPSEISAGSGEAAVMLLGAGFTPTSMGATLDSTGMPQPLTTTFLSATSLKVALPASLTQIPATIPMLVMDQGVASNSVNLVIHSTQPIVSMLPLIQNVTEAASFRNVLTPLSFGTVFGQRFADQEYSATSLPLPYELGGIKVTVNDIPAPIQYASSMQINFQVPSGVAVGSLARVVVIRDGIPGEVFEVPVKADAFGFFSYYRAAGTAQQSLDPILVTLDGQILSPDVTAHPGDTIVAYGTGVSSLNNPPADAQASPSDPTSTCAVTPTVTIRTDQGSYPVTVLYCGLTANFVSLVQLNLQFNAGPIQGGNAKLYVRFGDAEESEGVPLYFAN